jgi:molecular chaperone GrpE (heat shock protein)
VSAPEPENRRNAETEFEQRGPTIRDRRRIDPDTYEVREPQETAAPPTATAEEAAQQESNAEAEVIELEAALAERTSDLQRLQAEYVNYKRRVDRDRDLARKVTIEGVLKDFLSVLDDVRSAREHDELNGGFKAVAIHSTRTSTRRCCMRTLRASKGRPASRSCSPATGSGIAFCDLPELRWPSRIPMLRLLRRKWWRVRWPSRQSARRPSRRCALSRSKTPQAPVAQMSPLATTISRERVRNVLLASVVDHLEGRCL